jgi:hypothetical protein
VDTNNYCILNHCSKFVSWKTICVRWSYSCSQTLCLWYLAILLKWKQTKDANEIYDERLARMFQLSFCSGGKSTEFVLVSLLETRSFHRLPQFTRIFSSFIFLSLVHPSDTWLHISPCTSDAPISFAVEKQKQRISLFWCRLYWFGKKCFLER